MEVLLPNRMGSATRSRSRWIRKEPKILQRKLGKEADWKEWPNLGCTARFVPWGRGASKLVQMTIPDASGSKTIYFLAERPPALVDDVIKQNQAAWTHGISSMSPEQLQKLIPKNYPAEDLAPPGYEGITGVGVFPVDSHMKKEDFLVLTMEGWGGSPLCHRGSELRRLGPDLLSRQRHV